MIRVFARAQPALPAQKQAYSRIFPLDSSRWVKLALSGALTLRSRADVRLAIVSSPRSGQKKVAPGASLGYKGWDVNP